MIRRFGAASVALLLAGVVAMPIYPTHRHIRPPQVGSALCAPAVLGELSFPQTELTGYLRFAFGADRSADPNTWEWTNASAYLRHDERVTVTYGRSNEGQTSSPASLTFSLNSDEGRFVPDFATGAHYPNIELGTPVEWSVNPGNGLYERFKGFVSSWTPRWDITGTQTIVDVQANGVSRRLGQGEAVKTTIQSAIIADEPAAYWPLSDGSDATFAGSAIGGAPMTVYGGTIAFAQHTGLRNQDSAPEFLTTSTGAPSGRLFGPVFHAETGSWSIEGWIKATRRVSSPSAEQMNAWSWTITGTTEFNRAVMNAVADNGLGEAQVNIYFFDVNNNVVTFAAYIGTQVVDGDWHYVGVQLIQTDPSTYSLAARVDEETSLTEGLTGEIGAVGRVDISGYDVDGVVAEFGTLSVAHMAVYDSTVDLESHYLAGIGFDNETTAERFARVCTDESIIFTVDAGATSSMGPQSAGSVLDQFHEIDAVEHGILTDYQFGTRLIPVSARYNRAPDLTLDDGKLGETPQPTYDDLDVINDATAARPDGERVRHTDPADIARRGRYDADLQVNAVADELIHHAELAVHLGTVTGMRYPRLTLNLRRQPELIAAWCNAGLGARIRVTGLPDSHPANGIDVFVEGYTETFDSNSWTVEINASPARPYEVFEIESDEFGRLDTDDSELAVAVDEDELFLLVTTESVQWTTTAEYPLDFPLDIEIAGEQISVSAIADAHFIGRGSAAHDGNGGSVQPDIHADSRENDLIVLFAGCRDTAAVMDTPAGYSVLFGDGHVAAFYKIHSGSESAPTVTFAGAGANDTVSAQTATFRGVRPVVTNLGAQSNASAQNIAAPALTVPAGHLALWFGWKADDSTAIADILSGVTEIDQLSSTLGDDQSLVWNYSFEPDGEAHGATSWTVTGGANAVSKGYVLALPADRQAFTCSARAVNGVVKSHAAGSAVQLWRPGQVAI